jgi:hypothetical protein
MSRGEPAMRDGRGKLTGLGPPGRSYLADERSSIAVLGTLWSDPVRGGRLRKELSAASYDILGLTRLTDSIDRIASTSSILRKAPMATSSF